MRSRLGVGAWGAIWAFLTAGQAFVAYGALQDGAVISGAVAGLLVAVLQVAKVPFAIRRLHDLGRPADDAVLGLVPVANIGLWSQLTRKAPSEKRREALIAAWSGEVSAVAAFRTALGMYGSLLPVFLPFILLGGALSGGVDVAAEALLNAAGAMDSAGRGSIREVAWGVTVLLAVYAILQWFKRDRAGRSSWIPVLLLLPAALIALTLQLHDSKGLGLLVVSLPYQALDLVWGSFVGGALAVVWTAAADARLRGEAASWSQVIAVLRARWADAVAVHGAVYQLVFVGLQVLVPGIHYALVYSFADFHAVNEPERPSLARAHQLSHGIRRRLFVAQYLGFLVYMLISLGVWMVFADPSQIGAAMFDPGAVPPVVNFVLGPMWVAAVALIKVTLLVLWRDRMARLEPAAVPADANAGG
jgi:hypothetical protein